MASFCRGDGGRVSCVATLDGSTCRDAAATALIVASPALTPPPLQRVKYRIPEAAAAAAAAGKKSRALPGGAVADSVATMGALGTGVLQ